MSDDGNDLNVQVDDAPREEAVAPREEAIAPGDEVVAPRDEVAAPRDEVAAPRDEVAAPRDEVAAPRDEVAAPREDATAPADDLRGRLMRQFEQWLDEMLAGESAPPVPRELLEEALAQTAGADPSAAGTDLYSLFAALTTLTGEIRLQGRAFKQLTDAVAPAAQLPDAIKELEEAQHASAQQLEELVEQLQPEPSGDSSLPPAKDVLIVLFDLLERMERGLKTFEAGIASIAANPPRGLLARLSGADRQSAGLLETVKAMHEGYRLTASRLEAAVQQWGIQRVGQAGDPFDPTTMTAIEVDTTATRPPGTVVEVYRSGYVLHGEMLAVTQVKVAK